MRTIPLGPDAPPVGVIGYGGMHLSLHGRPPEAEAIRAVHAALDGGVTLIDTADAYCLEASERGHNERLLAKALRQWPGAQDLILIATKGGIVRTAGRWDRDGSPRHLQEACEASLVALGVEQIGLYQLHAPDPAVPWEESIGTLAELRRAGKIRFVGLSNVTVDQIRRAESLVPVTTVQNRLSPFFREALSDGVVDYCSDRGIGFLAYSPTGGGRLTLKLPSHPVLARAAERLGVTAHQVCLAWVVAQGRTVIPIPSARRAEHARSSAAVGDLAVPDEVIAAVDQAAFDRT